MKKSKKKKYKVVKTDLFKKQEKNLPPKVKKELSKVLKSLAKNPKGLQNSMQLFTKPSPEELAQWMGRVRKETIDLVFEYLNDKDCLNKQGKHLAHAFWTRYIQDKSVQRTTKR